MGPADQIWQRRASCRGPQSAMFFPPSTFERKEDKEQREVSAKAICASCCVKGACLEYAIRIRESHGIWGGLNEGERRVIMSRLAG